MIRVELGAEVSPGIFAFRVDGYGVEGRSHQPLLDACRAVKRMGADSQSEIGLFREGKISAFQYEGEGNSMKSIWAAVQTFSGREHLVRREIEKTHHGAFLPTYARVWSVDGKLCSREYPLLGGYVFFRTKQDGWGAVATIDGVCRVLSDGMGNAKRLPDGDMARLVLDHATGLHNRIELPSRSADGQFKRGKRYRRPRKSRRARGATAV